MANLSDLVSELNSVSAKSTALLRDLGISTVLDLASSAIFSLASEVERAQRAVLLGGQRWRGVIPADLIDPAYRTIPIEELATKPVSVIRSIGKALSGRLESDMGVRTVADLAKWPPYEQAKGILSVSAGGQGVLAAEDPEMPSDLVPSTGRYPTERVQYDVILLDRFLRKQADSGEHPPLTHIDPNYDPDVVAPVRPIEEAFTPIDVSKQPDAGFRYPAVGAVLTYNQSWYTLGLTLGQLLHSVALAPGETTRIAVVDWNRQQKAGTTETIAEGEALSAELTHGRAISEVTRAVASEAQTGFSQASNLEGSYSFGSGTGVAGEVMGFFGVAGASIANSAGYSQAMSMSVTTGRRDVAAEMSQNICDRTQQAANSTRNRRASIVREVSQKESETLSTRALTNFNHMHALTVQYYEVVQLYRTVVELAKVRRCLLLPMKVLDFTNVDIVRRFRPVLRQAAFSQEIRDLLTDDLSVVIHGNVGPNGPSSDVLAQLQAWQAQARVASSLELRGARWGEWYVPRTVGTHGAEFTWPPEAKVERITRIAADGKVTQDTHVAPGYHNWVHAHVAPLSQWGSFEITFADKQPESVKLPIRVQMRLYLTNLNREFDYRHIVEIGSDTDAGRTGESVPLIAVKAPPSEELVIAHLQENALHYSQAIWKSMSSAALVAQLEGCTFQGRPLAEIVDFTPIATVGNYVAFAFHTKDDAPWQKFLEEHPDLDLDNVANRVRSEEIVPIPSGGVFAEAVLGRFNSAEKLDITRFWNWQDSPIPITAPEIAPLQAGSRAQAENLTPGQLGQPMLNIVNAPAVPDPTGLSAVLTAVSNGTMFRDMSNAAQTMAAATEVLKTGFMAAGHSEDVAVKYADLAADLMKANMAAGGGAGGTSGFEASKVPSNISGLGAKFNAAAKLDDTLGNADGASTALPPEENSSSSTPSDSVNTSRRDEVLGTSGGGGGGALGSALQWLLQSSMGATPGSDAGAGADNAKFPWGLLFKWSDTDDSGVKFSNKYHDWVKQSYSLYDNDQFLCNWYPLKVLVDFAAVHSLRIRLLYWKGVAPTDGSPRLWDTTRTFVHDSHSGRFESKEAFYNTVKSTVTARMIGTLNTASIDRSGAMVGDLVLYDITDSYWHTQLIVSISTTSMILQAGNTPMCKPTENVRTAGGETPRGAYGGSPRRWNFARFDE